MAATMTRGAVILTPALILPARLTRDGRSVVHEIIGDTEPDVTSREPSSRAGDLQLIFSTAAGAASATDALSVVGGSWTIAGTDRLDGTWRLVGDVVDEPAASGVRSRIVTVTVREMST